MSFKLPKSGLCPGGPKILQVEGMWEEVRRSRGVSIRRISLSVPVAPYTAPISTTVGRPGGPEIIVFLHVFITFACRPRWA